MNGLLENAPVWVVIVVAALSSSLLTTGLSAWVQHGRDRRQRRVRMLERWRAALEKWNSPREDITRMPLYSEMRSVLTTNGLEPEGVEGRAPSLTAGLMGVSVGKLILQDRVAALAKKWNLD